MLAIIHRRSDYALAAALLLVAFASRAEASGARVRWAASADARVAGYRVYVRPAGTRYGAPLDVGRPPAAADGSISYVVSGLTAGRSYYFGVTAYSVATVSSPTPLESGFSAELAIGSLTPCRVDRCVTPTSCDIRVAADGSSCDDGLFCNGIAVCDAGSCRNGPAPSCGDAVACTVDVCDDALARCVHRAQPGCCTADAECLDNDRCTSSERCVAGTCVSAAATCPSSSCADAYCDPTGGCGLMPTPDGITCDVVGCGDGAVVLAPRRLVLTASSEGATLNLRARLQSAGSIDPTRTGFTLEVGDASGRIMYRAAVPGEAFVEKRAGTKFRYQARGEESVATGGISGVVLKLRKDMWSLNVRASSLDLFDALAQPYVTLAARFGDASCAENAGVACEGGVDRLVCR